MRTRLEELGPVKRKLTVDLPVERVVAALEAAYAKVQKTATLKGFRQGKAPRHLLEQYYRAEAEREAMAALVEATYPEARQAVSLVPVSRPVIEPGPFASNQPFTYAATVEIRPTVTLAPYTGFALRRTAWAVTDAEVEEQLQAARQALTRLLPAAEGTVLGQAMVARIDFEGTADGKPFEGSRATDHVIEMGAGHLLPAFEERILGMRAGETRAIQFTYPEEYFNVNLAGTAAQFRVTVKEIKRKDIPELSDDFARDLGNYRTLAEVRAAIRRRLEAARERQARAELGEQALKQLLDRHPFAVPESMVGWELEGLWREFERRAKVRGKTPADLGVTPEAFARESEGAARDRVRGALILDAIAQAEHLAVTDAEAEARLEEIARAVGQPLPKVRLHYEQQELLPALKREILHEKALDFIVGKSKIKVAKVKKGETQAK